MDKYDIPQEDIDLIIACGEEKHRLQRIIAGKKKEIEFLQSQVNQLSYASLAQKFNVPPHWISHIYRYNGRGE